MATAISTLSSIDLSGLPLPVLGFIVGVLLGALLFLAGLADPDKIVGALRLRDFHAMRVLAVFALVGLLGTCLLEYLAPGAAHTSVKPAAMADLRFAVCDRGTMRESPHASLAVILTSVDMVEVRHVLNVAALDFPAPEHAHPHQIGVIPDVQQQVPRSRSVRVEEE